MSQWGLWADELSLADQALLLQAFVRRKQFESKLLAVEAIKVLGLVGQTTSKAEAGAGTDLHAPGRHDVHASALLREMGISF